MLDFLDQVEVQTLFQKYVLNGGVLMYVLVPCSLVMLGAVFQGMIALRRRRLLPRRLFQKAEQVRGAEGRRDFLAALRGQENPLGRLIWLTLKDFDPLGPRPSRAAIEPKLDDALAQVSDRLYERVTILSTIYTVGPLLGLVGTIVGLMDTFHSYGALAHPSIQMLSAGVQKALVTTLWGLAMAIPAFMAGQWFQSKIRGYERDRFPEAAWRIIDAIYREAAQPAEPTAAEAGETPRATVGAAVLEAESHA